MARKKITILSDKSKGTLSSSDVARIVSVTLAESGIDTDFETHIMADGGQGTAEALGCRISECGLFYTFDDCGHRACYVPSCGEGLTWEASLWNGPFSKRTSEAVGKAVALALKEYPDSTVYVGIGGTMCADIGVGFLKALGFKFYTDDDGITGIEAPCPEVTDTLRRRIVGIADVRCPLVGDGLCALSFIPQKGGSPVDIARFKKTAVGIISQTASHGGPHAGAGGGLGYALESILGCRVTDGAAFVLGRVLKDAHPDMFITGEGCIDSQTEGGKVVHEVYRHAHAEGIPVVAFCGKLMATGAYTDVFPCSDNDSPVPADCSVAAEQLRNAVVRALPTIKQKL